MRATVFDFGGALEIYEELLAEGEALEPQSAQTYKSAAVAAMAQGRRGDAVRYFLRARRLGLGDEALGSGAGILRDEAREALDQAWAAQEEGSEEGRARAQELAVSALEHDPRIAADCVERARQAWRADRTEESASLAERALLVAPTDTNARSISALCTVRRLLESVSLEAAQEHLRRAVNELEPNSLLAAESAWLTAYAAAEAGQREHALELLAAALSHDPEHSRARAEFVDLAVEAGVDHLRAGEAAEARRVLADALAADGTRVDARHFLGQALFDAGEYASAAREWELVLSEARDGGLDLPEPVHVHLARALYYAGDESSSRATLEDYLATHPDGPFVEETRSVLEALPRGD
jgi:tetratricopeptide (TPR) repeat protein